jgi:hypothetical protein
MNCSLMLTARAANNIWAALRFFVAASKAGEPKNDGRFETINDDHEEESSMQSFAYFFGSAAAFLVAANAAFADNYSGSATNVTV